EIDGSEELASVGVGGIQTDGEQKFALGESEVFLFVGDACEFGGEARIARRLGATGFKGGACCGPAFEARESETLEEIELSGLSRGAVSERRDFLPALGVEGLLSGLQATGVRIGRRLLG